jgi:transposase-like protein
MTLQVHKLRSRSYFPDWLLERRRRVERAAVHLAAEWYVKGVSTRRVDSSTGPGHRGVSKSQVSGLAKSLDEAVEPAGPDR